MPWTQQAEAERGSLTLCGESFGSLPVFGLAFTEWQYDDILHICFVSLFQKKKKKKKQNDKNGKPYKRYRYPRRKVNESIQYETFGVALTHDYEQTSYKTSARC
jgi:hypothetical protein